MATHSSILAWKISWTEEPDGVYGPWGHKSQTRLSDETILIICLSIRAQDIVLLNIFNNNPTLLKGLL